MAVPGSLAMALWQQGTEGLSGRDVHLLMIFVGIIALALVVQAIGVLIAGMYGAKLLKRVDGIADGFEQKTAPILVRTNELLHDLSPKIRSISENVDQMSYTVRAKVDEIGETVSQVNRTVQEVNERTQNQIANVDAIVTEALIATEEISRTVQQGIRVPIRQVAGIVAGLKAAIETLVERSPFGRSRGGGRPFDL